MSTQTFDLHLRFTVSIDVGEATVTPVAAVPAEADDKKDPALALVPPAPPRPRTTKPRTPPAVTPTTPTTPTSDATPAVEPKADGDNNHAENPADAGGPP